MPERVHRRFEDPSLLHLNVATEQKPNAIGTNVKKRKRSSTEIRLSPKSHEQPLSSRIFARNRDWASCQANRPGLKEQAATLAQGRKKLPIWSHVSEIRSGLRDHDVMLIVGETGSGKSTQVPQMLFEETWCISQQVNLPKQTLNECKNKARNNQLPKVSISQLGNVGGCIAITEPRRVAAISLAERVAKEMGSPLGSSSPASKVGFSVRFNKSISPSTRIKFLTEGMLLQEMLLDPYLRDYSAVVLDEVHERGVNVDLLLGFLRQIVSSDYVLRGGVPLKVVVMSATAEVQTLREFFNQGFRAGCIKDQSANHDGLAPDGVVPPDQASEWSGLSNSEAGDEDYSEPQHVQNATMSCSHKVSSCFVEGRQYPVTIHYEESPVQNWLDTMLRTIFHIHHKEPLPGDILAFLTGQETVESLEKLITEHEKDMRTDLPKILVLPLFAALPQDAQQAIFRPPPPKTRKVILATNIAETSVTVPGVRFVIDCGKAKIKHFRTGIGLESLLVKPIARSAAIQRSGRAGREAPGKCWRMYTEQDYLSLPESNTPEILRCDLSQALLTMQARGIHDCYSFPFLERPHREAYEKAIMRLFQLDALDETGRITEVGSQMARLPLPGPLARTFLAATQSDLDCVSEVIDIIACFSVENIFVKTTTEESREQAETARRAMYRREGDHLTLLAAVQGYAAENADRKSWCQRHFVSHRAMKAVMDVRKQLRSLAQPARASSPISHEYRPMTTDLSTSILKSFIRGFAYNTALRLPDGSYQTVAGHQKVAIHPSSVLFGKPVRAILFNEFVFTNKSYARGVSAVEMAWLEGVWKDPGV